MVYSILHCLTIILMLQTVYNVEVTVNTCTCTSVFTEIRTNQVGYITVQSQKSYYAHVKSTINPVGRELCTFIMDNIDMCILI